jgi:hypothetical protein
MTKQEIRLIPACLSLFLCLPACAGEEDGTSGDESTEAGETGMPSSESGDGDGESGDGDGETGDGDVGDGDGDAGDGDGDAQGNACGLPEWNGWTPTNGGPMGRIVGEDGEGQLIDLCDFTDAPTLVDLSYPGCPPCESLSRYLSQDGDVAEDSFHEMWSAWANNINAKLEAGELNFITLVTDLTAFEEPGPADAWHETYPHALIHDLELHESTGVSYETLTQITTGFPSFFYIGADLNLISAPVIGASSPEEAYEGLILANEL